MFPRQEIALATLEPSASAPAGTGVAAGLSAAVVATLGMLAFGSIVGLPTVAEMVADAITATTPVSMVEGMIATFGSYAKSMLFGSVVLGQIAVGVGFAIAAERRGWGPAQTVAGFAGLVALVGVVILPLIGAGVLGANRAGGATAGFTSLLVSGALFTIAYVLVVHLLNPGGVYAEEDAAARRLFLKRAALTVGGTIAGLAGLRWLADRLAPPEVAPVLSAEVDRTTAAITVFGDLASALAAGVPGLSTEITPNDKFYVVSKNVFRDPVVNEQTWRLEIGGLVARPMVLTYDEVKQLPSAEQYFTLQCISNEVGGDLVGNAHWRGIALADLLRQAGLRPEAVDIVFHAADDYTDSIPVAKALEPGTMLAYQMNGAVLPHNHGFPARLLIPDIYGMKNVKWVTKIEALNHDYKGFWQNRGWSDVATMNTTSRIDAPKRASFLRPGKNYIGGIAVAGKRGIRRVDVSADGGRSWSPAVVKPALGPNAWVLWLYEWEMPAEPADNRLLVRATDGTGAPQPADIRGTLPDGASGLHTVQVRRAQG